MKQAKSKILNKSTVRIYDNAQGRRIIELLEYDIGTKVNDRYVEDIYFAECLRAEFNGLPLMEILAKLIAIKDDGNNCPTSSKVDVNKVDEKKDINTGRVLSMLDGLTGGNSAINKE